MTETPDPETVIPGAGDPPRPGDPPISRSRAPRGVQCDMCGCVLDADGKVLKRGEEAAGYIELADQLKQEKVGAAKLRDRCAELEAECAEWKAKAMPADKRRSWPF